MLKSLNTMAKIGDYDEYEAAEYTFHPSDEKMDYDEAVASCFLQEMWLADPQLYTPAYDMVK